MPLAGRKYDRKAPESLAHEVAMARYFIFISPVEEAVVRDLRQTFVETDLVLFEQLLEDKKRAMSYVV